MLTFFRYLPLILGPVIALSNSNWTPFIQLQTMTDTAYVPDLTEDVLNYFEEIQEHILLFKELYPTLPLKPKQHLFVYFKRVIKEKKINRDYHNVVRLQQLARAAKDE